MRLQLISDLHTEFHNSPARFLDNLEIAPDLDFLVVAGDTVVVNRQHEQDVIPSFKRFSRWARHVIWIEGNHEYYGSHDSAHTNIQLAAYVGKYPNIHWLRNESLEIDGVHFYGGAMWFPDNDGLNAMFEREIADFSQIKDLRHWVYRENRDFRYYALQHVKPETIVVTHHLPSHHSTPPIYRGLQSGRFFVSDEEKFIMEKQPRLWLHGHTHSFCDYKIGETRVLCNPHGYPSERGSKSYSPVVVEV